MLETLAYTICDSLVASTCDQFAVLDWSLARLAAFEKKKQIAWVMSAPSPFQTLHKRHCITS